MAPVGVGPPLLLEEALTRRDLLATFRPVGIGEGTERRERDSSFERIRAEVQPYVFASSIVGPVNDRFGQGGISWLTGTASWMHIAATQYLLGVRPTLDGLVVNPCLPAQIKAATGVDLVDRLKKG